MGRGADAFVVFLVAALCSPVVHADSVAQVATSKFLTEETVEALDCRVDRVEQISCSDCIGDPEFCPPVDPNRPDAGGGGGAQIAIRVGDILTFRITFTPVPNGQLYGGGGYITEYVPPGTEVVGVRMVDGLGNTVPPRRAGPMASGWGQRGNRGWSSLGLQEGGIAQVYCDTGIFYSTDPRTQQTPPDQFIDVNNGLLLAESPTGVGGFFDLIGATNGFYYAHNSWDQDQAYAFGTNNAPNGGQGTTAHGYGSAVAGPDTWYGFEASPGSPVTDPVFTSTVGPWQRIAYPGSETCTGSPSTATGVSARVGVPTTAGRDISSINPLPANTNAVRYAIGELIVGEEYFAEVSLRVLSVPLHPTLGNVNCGEVFGGDASFPEVATGSAGKDNPWRYFLPAPTCTNVDVFFGKSVDKPLALNGDTLTYTLRILNLSAAAQTNVIITDLIDTANGANYVSATGDMTVGPPSLAGNILTWPTIPSIAPGEEHLFTVVVDAGNPVTINQAFFNSDTITNYRAVAFTLTQPIARITQTKTAAPDQISAGGTVTYTITIANDGTADAANGIVHETLPTGWMVVAGSTLVNGAAFGDPTFTAPKHIWTGLPTIVVGDTLTLTFDVLVPGNTTPGVYTNTFLTAFGRTENKTFDTARVGVDVIFSDAPVVNAPILVNATSASGTSTEADATAIRVLVDGIERAQTTVTGGVWTATGLPNVFVGQRVTAFAKAPGEEESNESLPVVVEASDGGNATSPDGGPGGGFADAGGDLNGSGGCCSIVGHKEPTGSLPLLALLVVGTLAVIRRRR